MIVSHTPNIGVSPQWEDLTNDGHPPQGAVNQLHDISITHLLKMKKTGGDQFMGSFPFILSVKYSGTTFYFTGTLHHEFAVFQVKIWMRKKTMDGYSAVRYQTEGRVRLVLDQ